MILKNHKSRYSSLSIEPDWLLNNFDEILKNSEKTVTIHHQVYRASTVHVLTFNQEHPPPLSFTSSHKIITGRSTVSVDISACCSFQVCFMHAIRCFFLNYFISVSLINKLTMGIVRVGGNLQENLVIASLV